MADLAFGISKAAIQLLADKVKNAIKEEAEQWQTMERDLVFITGEFEMMQSFLDTATEERVKNKIVATWIRQVRNLSFDVEDNIDSLLLLDTKKKRWWLRLLPSFGKSRTPRPLDLAVAETALLRARVVDVSQRNIRYNLIVDSASKPMASMDLVPVQKTAASSSDALINAVKKSGLLDLAGLITRQDRDLHVVSVCGTEGDLANVAIVRKMYSDSRIHKGFQCRAWVKLVHPFNPLEFIRSLMTQFLAHSWQEQVNVDPDELERILNDTNRGLLREFAEKENNQSYIIVLEDISTLAQWDAIRLYLPDRKKGSRIVVLTHHPVVASQCTGEPCRVSEIGQFLQCHSLRVYYKEAFQHGKSHSLKRTESDHSLFHYVFGRDTEMDKLFEQTKSQESQFISVWGMPGIGKSALVAAVHDKLRTTKAFRRYASVRVSHPFNPMDLCRSLLEENSHRASTSSKGAAFRAEDPINECRDYLCALCLLVIDGVQSNEEWDWIKSNLIQYGDSKSCVIIITSQESVAKYCAVSIDAVYNVKGLHPIAANGLFQKVLQEKECNQERLHEEEVGLLLSKCGGHPRVIITVAEYLASKPKDMFKQEMRRLSDNFLQELATNPKFDSLRDIQAWMHSCFHSCPRHLRKHMLYLSIFPPNVIVRRRRLIRRWVAEGYSKGTDSNSSEKYAEKMFDEVEALSIIEPELRAGNKIGYRVNGLFREYIISRPVEETIFFPVEVSALENQGQGRLTTEGIGQHLAIGSTWDDDQIVFESLDKSRLRSLTVFDKWFRKFYILADRMRVLRVLDLENAYGLSNEDLEFVLVQLKRLKFLSLRGQREISKLPDSVGEVVPLQTLDIRGTSITTLPQSITKLRNLQYILAGTVAWTVDEIISSSDAEGSTTSSTCRSRGLASCLPKNFLTRGPVVGSCSSAGIHVPKGIRRLEALHTLGVVHVKTTDGEDILSDMLFHLKLKKLEVSGISREQELSWICDLLNDNVHLESLSLQIERNHPIWEEISIPINLRSLKIYGHVQQLPRSITDAVNLAKLTLATTILFTEEVIELLGRIPSLRTLRLRVLKDPQDGVLRFPNKNLFSRLLVLEIASKSKLHVRFDVGAMEKLEHLNVHCLRGSVMQVSGLEHLQVSIKQVYLMGYFEEALEEAVQQQLIKHPNIPAPKLEVWRW